MAEDPTAPADPAAPLACLRCGSFVHDGPIPLLPLCAACAKPDRRTPNPVFNWAPRASLWRRGFLMLALGNLAVFGLLSWDHGPDLLTALLFLGPHAAAFVVLGAALGLLFLGALLVLLWMPLSPGAWTAEVLEPLGIPVSRLSQGMRLAIYLEHKFTGFELRNPVHPGLLVEGTRGVAFLGANGTRACIPLRDVARVTVEVALVLWPPRRVLRLDLRDGSMRRFALLAGAGSLAATRECAQRLLQAQLADRPD